MASSRVAAAIGFSSLLAATLAAGSSSGCAKSDAIEQPAAGSAAGSGGGPATGPGSGGAGPTTTTTGSSGDGGGAATTTSSGSTSQASTGSGGDDPGSGGGGSGGTSSSSGSMCGDGVIQGVEACDGADLDGATCENQGFANGTIACSSMCELDLSGCSAVTACANGLDDDGDGLIDDDDPGCTSGADDDELVYSATCDGAGTTVVDLTAVEGLPVDYLGTTDDPAIVNNFTSTVGGACPSTPGPEVALRFEVVNVIDTMVISLDNPGTTAGWDPVLYVRAETCTGLQVGCNDDGGGLASVLVLSNLQPGVYYIFVDGLGAGDAGDFEITLTPS